MPRNQSEKAPSIEGIDPQVIGCLQGVGYPDALPVTLLAQYEGLGFRRRIAYRSAYREFIHAQKSK